jgi:hypothetical protein
MVKHVIHLILLNVNYVNMKLMKQLVLKILEHIHGLQHPHLMDFNEQNGKLKIN